MAKTTRRKASRSTVRRSSTRSRSTNDSLLGSNSKGIWGKDQPMVLALSAGIVILIVLALFLTGWL